jgi:hypothetical protein
MRAKVSRATELYRQIVTHPAPGEFLAGWINQTHPEETEYLDFKRGAPQDKDRNERWSEALSGFANTEGGVLIWGVDARPERPNTIDMAQGLMLVPDPKGFKQKLNAVLLEAVVDPVPGVEIEAYDCPGNNGGFVVCLIPETSNKPHRAELAGKQYFQRVRDKFTTISHALLRSLFYPDNPVRLEFVLDASCEWVGSAPALHLLLAVTNVGTTSANQLFIRAFADNRFQKGKEYSRFTVSQQNLTAYFEEPSRRAYSGVFLEADKSLHPGQSIKLMEWVYRENNEVRTSKFTFLERTVNDTWFPRLSEDATFILYAHMADEPMQEFKVRCELYGASPMKERFTPTFKFTRTA